MIFSKVSLRNYFGNENNKESYFVDSFITILIFLTAIISVLETYNFSNFFFSLLHILDIFILHKKARNSIL